MASIGHDLLGSKLLHLEELQEKGKAANISAEMWNQHQSGFQSAVKSHESLLGALTGDVKNLELQVKAIARILTSQNVPKINETIATSQEDLYRKVMENMEKKMKQIEDKLDFELSDITDSKSGLTKRIDGVEMKLMATIEAKAEEARNARYAMKDDIEAVKDLIESMPDTVTQTAKVISNLENKVASLREDFKALEASHESANIQQDKDVANFKSEIWNALEAARDKLIEESKIGTRMVNKRMGEMFEKVHAIEEGFNEDMQKALKNDYSDKITQVKHFAEKTISDVELIIDRKVRPFNTSIAELRFLVGEEKTHREASDSELSRALAKERGDRDHDDQRLLALISTCTAAVSKMHKVV
eukprot:TRINITY_DN21881_c0_g1_i4.p1 TRINITY_DN21881_c0_g1~~TRINITY_DN21881_c0_g1_i4.p1  ORF type:complete len:360 (-),score=104.07 TRINITY_DN21881_c0_g1_i4:220-1299(-)